jgi:MFS family permease
MTVAVAPTAGFLFDRFGLNYGIYFSLSVLVLSQASLLLALHRGSFMLAASAKLLAGIGFDPLTIAKQIILTSWFYGR